MPKLYPVFLFCFFPLQLFSQKIIKGTVTDAGGNPLPYASIRIANSGTGTMSNKMGQFTLKVPFTQLSDTVLISFLGYREMRIPIVTLPSNDIHAKLERQVQDLQEVIIKPLNPLDLLREAIARIPDNYYNRPYISHGFYRVDTKKGEEHIMLSEAVFDIMDQGYAKGRNNSFRLHKMRSVQDEQASHGIDLGIKPKNLYEYDIVHDISESGLLNKKGLGNHQFKLVRVTTFNGYPAYEISFDQREGVKESLYKGRIYLETSSLAIMSVVLSRSPRGLEYAKFGSAGDRALMKLIGLNIDLRKDDITINYQPYGGKWLLAGVRNDNILNFKSNRAFYDFPADIRVDYIITGVDTTGVASFSAKETLGNNKLIEYQEEAFEKDFWEDHNIILADYNSDTIAAAITARNESFSLKRKLQARMKKLPKDPAARIDSILSFYYQQGAFNGSALVKHNGHILLRKGYGMADKEKNVPATNTTQYRIGSLTKTFTSLLIQQLAAESRLQLSDSLGRFLPGYIHGRVTVEQLLTHTSGIPSYTNSSEAVSAVLTGNYTIREILDRFGSDSLEFVPGSQFHYSNTGYLALAAIIERLSDKSYGQALQEKIFTPLGMKQTVFGNTPLNSKGYWMDTPEIVYNPANTAGAGGIASTVDDLLLWDEALNTDHLVSKQRIDQSFEAHASYNDWDAWYGYGWMIDRKLFKASKEHKIIYHPGTDFGYYAMFVRVPETNSLIILLSNTGDFPRFDITDLLLEVID